jgi:predicted Zn-dependent protease
VGDTVARDPERRRRLARLGTILAVVLLLLIVTFPLLSGFVAPLVPDRVQGPVGAEMVKSAAAQGEFCRGEQGRAALEGLARRLAEADDDDKTYKIYVNDADVLNAFAAPGGHIVLFRGVIEHADSADEVAGVLSHEMGHVAEDHPAKGLVEALGYGVFGLLTPFGDADSSALARTLLTNHYSRSDELDADRVGVEMLNRAGLDSHGLLAFFEHIKKAGAEIPGALEFLSTHPSGDSRSDAVADLVQDGEPALDDAQWQALRTICQDKGAAEPIVIDP